jgi:hypothetical protein
MANTITYVKDHADVLNFINIHGPLLNYDPAVFTVQTVQTTRRVFVAPTNAIFVECGSDSCNSCAPYPNSRIWNIGDVVHADANNCKVNTNKRQRKRSSDSEPEFEDAKESFDE